VRAWIKTLPKGTLRQWEAFDAVEPVGEHWRQTAEITTMLARQIEYTVALKTGNPMEPTTIQDNMPSRYRRIAKPKPKPVKQSTEDKRSEFERVASSLGLGKIVREHGRINQPS